MTLLSLSAMRLLIRLTVIYFNKFIFIFELESELISPPPSPPSSPGLPFDPIALLAPKVGKDPLEQKRRIVQGKQFILEYFDKQLKIYFTFP